MKAWSVAVAFMPPGPLIINAVMAPSSEAAVAFVMMRAMRDLDIKEELAGVAAQELQEDFIRAALRGGEPAAVHPLRVVEAPAQAAPLDPVAPHPEPEGAA